MKFPILESLKLYNQKSEDISFLKNILSIFWELATIKKKEFNRVLPFGDNFVDRWEKATFLGFGEGSSVYDSSIIMGNVTVGKKCWIGPNTLLDGSGGLTIGDHCDISAGVQIYTHDTVNRVIHSKAVTQAPTTIGNHCYIGPGSIITKGVIIGDYVIIGANSFINKNIPSYSKGHGTPFKTMETVTVIKESK